jgi:hypothetical protein
MARMIPHHCDRVSATSGELRAFDASPGLGDGYTVLHSLALAEHVRLQTGQGTIRGLLNTKPSRRS